MIYFAALRDAVGKAEEALELVAPSYARSTTSARRLATVHAAYGQARSQVRVAHNDAFATGAEPLADGDTVALLPPVAGG